MDKDDYKTRKIGEDFNMFVLEYNHEKGMFHQNLFLDNHPKENLSTYGWEPVALTTDYKAILFCDVMECKIKECFKRLKHYPTVETVKKEWRYFCLYFNVIISDIFLNNGREFGTYANCIKQFDLNKALAKINNPNFEYLKEDDEGIGEITDYDATSFIGSNF